MTQIEIKTRSIMKSLSSSEKKVANYLLQNIDSIYSTPIAKLASQAGVSQVTWIRFCKSIGFKGLKDLKKALVQELNNSPVSTQTNMEFSDIRQVSSIEQVCHIIRSSNTQAITDTLSIIDADNFEKIVNIIATTKNMKLFGVGASALVANDFSNKLLRINKPVTFSYDTHIQLTYGANLTADDVAIFFSYSGQTKELLEIMQLAKESGCTTIAITKYNKNPLANAADYKIYVAAPEIVSRSGAMSSRIAQLTIVDLLFTCLANKLYPEVEIFLEKSAEIRKTHRV